MDVTTYEKKNMKLYYLVCVFLHHVGNKLIDLIFWVCTYMLVFINHVWNIFQQRSLPCQKNLRPQQKKISLATVSNYIS